MKKLSELLSTLALLIVLSLAVLLVGVRLIGLTPYSVLSGSMEPTYSTGDLIYVKKVPLEEIETGMPVTYVANEHLVIATHRVMDIEIRTTRMEPIIDERGKAAMGRDGKPIMQEIPLDEPAYYFLTMGDADPDAEPATVYGKNILGTPVASLPYLGLFATMVKTPAGMVMVGCFGLLLVILMFLPEMLRAIEGKSAAQEDEPGEDTAEPEDELVCDARAGDDVVLAESGEGSALAEEKPADGAAGGGKP